MIWCFKTKVASPRDLEVYLICSLGTQGAPFGTVLSLENYETSGALARHPPPALRFLFFFVHTVSFLCVVFVCLFGRAWRLFSFLFAFAGCSLRWLLFFFFLWGGLEG